MNILEKLNELYKGNSYFEKYGISVFLTILIISIVAVIFVYINIAFSKLYSFLYNLFKLYRK